MEEGQLSSLFKGQRMIFHKPIPVFEDHERFFKFIKVDDEPSGCWIYKGHTNGGYGVFYFKKTVAGKNVSFLAHRIAWSIFKGSFQKGLVIDHICMNKACVNPDHLREVTIQTNVLENSKALAVINKAKTHCQNGHAFTPENTLTCSRTRMSKQGVLWRSCRKCVTEYKAAWFQRKKALLK